MGVESRAKKRICYLAAGAIALFGIPAAMDRDTAGEVLEALARNRADCSVGIKPNNPNYLFDAIAVPGAGRVRMPDGSDVLKAEGKMRLEATAFAFLKGVAPRVIILGGLYNPGAGESVDAAYFKNVIRELTNDSQTIRRGVIIEDGQSVNTATNMEELAKKAKEYQIAKVAMVTNRSHELRATLMACIDGVATSPLSAEDLLVEQDPQQAPSIDKMYNSFGMWVTRAEEELKVLGILLDNRAGFQTFLRRMGIF